MKRVLGLAVLGLGANALAIINGVAVEPALRPEIVSVDGGRGTCGGVVVGSRVVLTTASCLKLGSPTATVHVGDEEYAASAYASPLYPGKQHDFAVLVTGNELNASPVRLGKAPAIGSEVELTGFGCHDRERPQETGLSIGNSRTDRHEAYFFRTMDPTGAVACYGDTGGPVFQDGRIVGLIAFANLKDTTYVMRVDNSDSRKLMLDVARKEHVDICGLTTECP